MPVPHDPSQDDLAETFRRMHKPDWPVHSWAELSRAALLHGLVLGSAYRLANGHKLVEPVPDLTGPITAPPVRTHEHPARLNGTRPSPSRRQSDHTGVDLKSRAAGERDDD